MKHILLIFFCLCLFITACKKTHEHPVNFYYWKSKVSITEVEQNYFMELACKKLYIRFFDISVEDNQMLPKAKIDTFDVQLLHAEYVPVIFITNQTFSDITSDSINSMSKNVWNLIEKIQQKNRLPEIKEIQIDCDWTDKTKSAYFLFLSTLKKVSGKDISCTLRLHQVKYKDRTGVPPVFKVYLMCYATSDPKEMSDKNSILDLSLLKDYTRNIEDYPLDFDVALPLYSWGIVMNHLGKIKLINGVTEEDFKTLDFKQVGENIYKVQTDIFFRGLYLNKDFTVKIEKITPALLDETKHYLCEKINKPYHIVYYHLDKTFLERFTIQELR